MTRQYNHLIHCINCGAEITAETGFSRWVRTREDLHSIRDGVVVSDLDYIVHKYRTELGRDFQCFMFIEVKSRKGQPTKSQSDTLLLVDQFLKNRRSTPTKKGPRQATGAPLKAFSLAAGKEVTVRAFGGYVLQFEQTGPLDSKWIRWGAQRQEINSDQLAALLRFDLDPDTLAPMDWRSHHCDTQMTLDMFEESAA
jgi:hypothetical protein